MYKTFSSSGVSLVEQYKKFKVLNLLHSLFFVYFYLALSITFIDSVTLKSIEFRALKETQWT